MSDALILCDIGGTFARFAVAQQGQVQQFCEYRAADFPDMAVALQAYARQNGFTAPARVLMATAAYESKGQWRFVNQNPWVIDPLALRQSGWDLRLILNDFEAATWGLLSLCGNEAGLLHAGDHAAPDSQQKFGRVLLGPGTGLGLGYLFDVPGHGHFVQKTHGGHMPLAAATPEQAEILTALQAAMLAAAPVYETIVSGPGLLRLYNLLRGDTATPATQAAQVLAESQTVHGRKALRLFHEFWGLFAATAIISGNAYGGLYLTGGMTGRLRDQGLLDVDSLRRGLLFGAVASVTHDLSQTPIYAATDPLLAMKGLLQAAGARQ